jgi:hypothetical protein
MPERRLLARRYQHARNRLGGRKSELGFRLLLVTNVGKKCCGSNCCGVYDIRPHELSEQEEASFLRGRDDWRLALATDLLAFLFNLFFIVSRSFLLGRVK